MLFYFTIKVAAKIFESQNLAAFVLVFPLFWVASSFLVYQSANNNIDGSRLGKISYKQIKNIITEGYYLSQNGNYCKSKLYSRIGYLKDHLKSCKKMKCNCFGLWEKIVNLKKINGNLLEDEENASQESIKIENKISLQNKCLLEIDDFILKTFCDQNPKDQFAMMLYLTWIMKNKMNLYIILAGIKSMKKLSINTKDRYYCYYTEHTLKQIMEKYYYHPELTFIDNPEIQSIGFRNTLTSINEAPIDLNYVFQYKQRMAQLCSLIKKFIDLNCEYIKKIQMVSSPIKTMFSDIKDLELLNSQILDLFKFTHEVGQTTDFYHLGPYFYYLRECLNMHKSASKIYSLYKKRLFDKKQFLQRVTKSFINKNLYFDSILMILSSQKTDFGTVIDVYGEVGKIDLQKEDLIDSNMDTLIPNLYRKYHKDACDEFMSSPFTPFLGKEIQQVFLTLPETNEILLSNFCLKLIPEVKQGFNFIISVKPWKLNSKMYIILDENLKTESYSTNICYMFSNSNSTLKTGERIQDICHEVYKRISRSKDYLTNIENELDMAAYSKSIQAREKSSKRIKRRKKRKRTSNRRFTQKNKPDSEVEQTIETSKSGNSLFNTNNIFDDNFEQIISQIVLQSNEDSEIIDKLFYIDIKKK